MYNSYFMLVALVYFNSLIVDGAIQCSKEDLQYAIERRGEFCVFRGVQWRKGTPEPEFQQSEEIQVAFVDSNLTRIPDGFYNRFPQLRILVANNVNLEMLKIKNNVRTVYAQENRIRQVEIDGGQSLKELYLNENPIQNIANITHVEGLEVLDLSGTDIAESNDNTIEFKTFVGLDNLKELYLSNLEAHYVENESEVTLPKLKLLDLSRNPIIPSNFHLRIFRRLPSLEEVSLRDAMMSELTVTDIRHDLPSLQRINIDGNDFSCSLLEPLLEHLKKSNINVIRTTDSNSRRCLIGYHLMDHYCCKSEGFYNSNTRPIQPPGINTTPAATSTLADGEGMGAGEVTPKTANDSQSTDDGSSSTVIILSVLAVIVVLVIAAIAGIYLKRRSQETHKAVPRNDPNDNL